MTEKIWITSDTHFGHDKEFLYKTRGFNSITEHDEEIIKRWNALVGKDDQVFHLGDVMLFDDEYGMNCLRRLNGNIHIIVGNHDTIPRVELYKENGYEVSYAWMIRYGERNFYLSHYPSFTKSRSASKFPEKKVFNLFGHTHQTTLKFQMGNKMFEDTYHVGVDAHDMTPVLMDDIFKEFK